MAFVTFSDPADAELATAGVDVAGFVIALYCAPRYQ